uniref:Parvovirus non-structural protein 1 helicase domain-containing protein n=1 Tax=Parvoviridae sp. TaxID=1940570 RepID=A0A7D3UI69_9VIRU|nr:MAG: hypothetical protein [Parvoviridae sp.]
MAQRQLNFPKLAPKVKTYNILIGHETLHIIHPELFAPKAKAYKDGKPIVSDRGWEKSYPIPEWDLPTKTVTAWTSKQSHYCELDNKQKAVINYIKTLLNCEKWQCLVVFHGTDCRANKKQYTYGNHLHVILQTTVGQFSREGAYRSMYEAVTAMGGRVTLTPVKDNIQGLLKYYQEDDEKIFMGSSGDELRELWATAQEYNGPRETEGEEETEPDAERKRKAVPFIKQVKRNKPEDAEDITEEETQVPSHLQNKQRLVDNVNFLIEILRKNKDTRDINQLTTKYGLFSEEGKALCNIALSNNGPKAFALALRQVQDEDDKMTLEERVKELPDLIPEYMDITSSQALFNAWCAEQRISPRKYAMTMQMLLAEKSYKRIGVYLQGRPNSGKTALTNNMWKCMGQTNGRITKETFCFQDCAGRKLIIGEEIAITEANVDRFKDLLSGGTVMCEIKQKAPVPCTPKIVLINSNNRYDLNIGRASAEQIRVRLYLFQDLQVSKVLGNMTGHFHPRMFYDNILPISQEETDRLKNNTGDWDMEPLGGTQFTGDWGEVFGDAETEMHKEVPYDNLGFGHEEEVAASKILQGDITPGSDIGIDETRSPASPDHREYGMLNEYSQSWPDITEWVPEKEDYETVETPEHERQVQEDMLALAMQAADKHRQDGNTWEEAQVEGEKEVREMYLNLAEEAYKSSTKAMDNKMKEDILAAATFPKLLRTEPLENPEIENLAYNLARTRAEADKKGYDVWTDVQDGVEIGDGGEFYSRVNYLEQAVLRGYTPAPATLRLETDDRAKLLEQIRDYSKSPINLVTDKMDEEWNSRWNSQPDSEPLDADNVISSERKRKIEDEEDRQAIIKRVRRVIPLETFMTKTNYKQRDGRLRSKIGSVLNDVQTFYSRRIDENADRWQYTIVFRKKTEYSVRGDGDTPWTPDTCNFIKTSSMFHLGGYFNYTHRLCGNGTSTELILQDSCGWRAMDINIPTIYTINGDIDKVIIKSKARLPEGQMSQYIRTSADTIPTEVSPCDDEDTIAEKCFNFIRLLRQDINSRHECVMQARNNDLWCVKKTLMELIDDPEAEVEDHEILRLFEMYFPFVSSVY